MNPQVEELKAQIQSTDDERQKFSLMGKLFAFRYIMDKKQNLELIEEMSALALRLGDQESITKVSVRETSIYFTLGQLESALTAGLRAKILCEELGNKKFLSEIYNTLGVIHVALGIFDGAFEYLSQSLKIDREQGDRKGEWVSLLSIGRVYAKLGDAERAKTYFLEGLEVAREIGEKEGIAQGLLNLGSITFLSSNDPTQGFDEVRQSLQYAEERNLPVLQANALDMLGRIYIARKDYEQAMECFSRALTILPHDVGRPVHIWVLSQMGRVHQEQGKYKEALQCFRRALVMAEEGTLKQSVSIVHELLANYYNHLHKYKKAFEHYRYFHTIKEELFNEESQQKIRGLTVLHEVEKTRHEKELAEKEKEIFRLRNDELSSALKEVQLLNRRLVLLNQEKNEVMGIVAHDLKSPLSGVKLVSDMLEVHYRRIPSEEVERQLATISQTTERMLMAVTNLLDVEALESGSMQQSRERIGIRSVLEPLLGEHRGRAEQKQIAVEYVCGIADESEIVGDRTGLEQVIENILSNAVKFTRVGGMVQVRLVSDTKVIRLEVSDEGPGIGKKDRDRIFEKYGRLSARPTGGESSTGLGLWIVKKNVEMFGGKVSYRTRVGKGTIFIVELPQTTTR